MKSADMRIVRLLKTVNELKEENRKLKEDLLYAEDCATKKRTINREKCLEALRARLQTDEEYKKVWTNYFYDSCVSSEFNHLIALGKRTLNKKDRRDVIVKAAIRFTDLFINGYRI